MAGQILTLGGQNGVTPGENPDKTNSANLGPGFLPGRGLDTEFRHRAGTDTSSAIKCTEANPVR